MSPRFVYANNDGPQDGVPTTYDASTLLMTAKVGPGFTVQWSGEHLTGAAASLVLAKQAPAKKDRKSSANTDEVILFRRVVPAVSSQRTLNAPDHHIMGVDFRTKQGRRLDAQKKEYGQTFSNAAKKPTLMNDEEVREKKKERIKRARDATNEAIEAVAKGQPLPVPEPKAGKGKKAAKKSAGDDAATASK